ncbi:MAG: phosphatase PAP2 family protein [Prevotella sp.]
MIETLINIDRSILLFLNGSNSLFLDGMMQAWTSGLTWIPFYVALFYLVVKNNETMAQIGLIVLGATLCLVLDGGVIELLVKPLAERLRPINDSSLKQLLDIVPGTYENSFSFFSAHAANTFSIAMFFSLLIKNRLFTAFMLIWSFINCYTRLYLGVHFPSDVLVGLLYGGCIGIFVYILYNKVCKKLLFKKSFFSTQYTSTGYAISDIEMVLIVMCLIILYTIFRGILYFV